jgi:lysozyme
MESCDLNAYRDQGGVWTIGWGHTGPEIQAGVKWTQAQADAALQADLDSRVTRLRTLCAKPLGDNQFSALLSLGYNIGMANLGGSSALRLANEGSFDAVPAAIALWNKITVNGAKQLNRGLIGRRAAECALWALADSAVPPFPNWNAIRQAAVAQFAAGEV